MGTRRGICKEDLEREVVVPIRLPEVTLAVYDKLEKKEKEVLRAFRRFARSAGVSEVFFPYFDGCKVMFEQVDLSTVDVWVFRRSIMRGRTTEGIVFMVALHATSTLHTSHIAFPIARLVGDDFQYRDSLRSLILTSAFIERNPVVVEAFKKALSTVFNSAASTYTMAVRFYGALRMLGAEEIA